MYQCSSFSMSSPAVVMVCHYYNHSSGFEVVFHCDYDLHVLMVLSIFSCACGHFCIIFGKTCIEILCPFLNFFYGWILRVCFKIYSRYESFIRYVIFKKFLYSLGCLFTFLISSETKIQFMYFSSFWLLIPYLRSHYIIQYHKDLHLCFF